MATKVDFKTKQIQELCKKFNVKALYLFGSATTDDFSEDSDLDFIVKFDRQGFEGAFEQYIDFKHELEQMFGRSVDLYHYKKFRNSIFQEEIERSKKLLVCRIKQESCFLTLAFPVKKYRILLTAKASKISSKIECYNLP